MQTKEKRLLIIAGILLIVFVLLFVFMRKSKTYDNINDNDDITEKTLDKEYSIEGLNITDLELYSEDGMSRFIAKITNTTDHTLNIATLSVSFYDKNNDLLFEENILYHTVLESNDSQYTSFYGSIELNNIKDIKFNVTYE